MKDNNIKSDSNSPSKSLFQRSRDLAKEGKYSDGLSVHDIDTDPNDDLELFRNFNLVKNHMKRKFHEKELNKLKDNSQDLTTFKNNKE